MSLFPAYKDLKQKKNNEEEHQDKSSWLENNSFAADTTQKDRIAEITKISDLFLASKEPSEPIEEHDIYKKIRKQNEIKPRSRAAHILEFHNEEFYMDKKPALVNKTTRTLHKPACPRYRSAYSQKLGISEWALTRKTKYKSVGKRYYRYQLKTFDIDPITPTLTHLKENQYLQQISKLNRQTMENPANLEPWMELVDMQELNPYRWPRPMVAEKQLAYVQRALVYHPRCEHLYRHYINIINATYPSFEVSKMLDKLLTKDSQNYMLWTAQIMATQGSMARCVVPDVLRIYERCMQKLHHSIAVVNTPISASDFAGETDKVMLKLFNNCALFLRQAGLYEFFFALIKLALELNVSTDQFGDFPTLDADQFTLIEYEELILQSGLPLNEIWLRIEKLRQGFNFLPYSPSTKCADPQRIIVYEDVSRYIYPIKQRENSFYLMLLILRLLKLPFVQCDSLAEKFCARVEDIGDSDAIEDMLAICVRRTYLLPQHDEFVCNLYELAKELAVSPTYLNNNIGHEIYSRFLNEMILNCATVCANIDERQRIIFILLWCRFQRLLLVLERCSGKLCPDYVKAGRNRFKSILKKPENRNVLHLYTEFALYEFEALSTESSLDSIRRTFDNIIVAHTRTYTELFSSSFSDLSYMLSVYSELLICRGMHNEALQVIVTYILCDSAKQNITTAKKLYALQRINEKLDSIIAIEQYVDIMVLEQYLIPDYTVTLLKLRTLLLCLLGQKLKALEALDKLFEIFRRRDSDRHSFLRENVYELYVMALQFPCINCIFPNAVISTKLFAAFTEYPRNLFLLQRCSLYTSVPWYKLRSILLRDNPSVNIVIFIIVAARYRFIQKLTASKESVSKITGIPPVLDCDRRQNEVILRNRYLSLFSMITSNASSNTYKAMLRNALFWRFYLRCLSDHSSSFERSKQCLHTALNNCPWVKALYLDGIMYIPQELSHLQDLMIEKQIRMCALPEELEILRKH